MPDSSSLSQASEHHEAAESDWSEIIQSLEKLGITVSLALTYKDMVLKYFENAIAAGELPFGTTSDTVESVPAAQGAKVSHEVYDWLSAQPLSPDNENVTGHRNARVSLELPYEWDSIKTSPQSSLAGDQDPNTISPSVMGEAQLSRHKIPLFGDKTPLFGDKTPLRIRAYWNEILLSRTRSSTSPPPTKRNQDDTRVPLAPTTKHNVAVAFNTRHGSGNLLYNPSYLSNKPRHLLHYLDIEALTTEMPSRRKRTSALQVGREVVEVSWNVTTQALQSLAKELHSKPLTYAVECVLLLGKIWCYLYIRWVLFDRREPPRYFYHSDRDLQCRRVMVFEVRYLVWQVFVFGVALDVLLTDAVIAYVRSGSYWFETQVG